jgi:hypothetical protein
MSAYLVNRDGQELGSFEVSELQDGLKTGFFRATDLGWRDGMTHWQALPEIAGTGLALPKPNLAPLSPLSAPVKKAVNLNPYAAPSAGSQSAAIGAVPSAIISELTGTKKWVRLISVVMWIGFAFVMLHAISLFIFGAVGLSSFVKSGQQGLGVGLLIGAAAIYGVFILLIIYPAIKLTKYASNISRLAESKSFTDLAAALAEQRRFWKFHGIIVAIYLIIVTLFILLALAGAGMSTMANKAKTAARSPAGRLELRVEGRPGNGAPSVDVSHKLPSA